MADPYNGVYGSGSGISPDAGDVREGVEFGDGETGTLVVPSVNAVVVGTSYGADGTELTGQNPGPPAASEDVGWLR